MSTVTLAQLETLATSGPVAVVVVLEAKGSTPRGGGTWMAVTREDSQGTIGGGEVELRAIAAARHMLDAGTDQETLRFQLGPALDQCCGGAMEVLVSRIAGPVGRPHRLGVDGPVLRDPSRHPVYVYGAGHVGTALVKALEPLDFQVEWIDGRAEQTSPPAIGIPCRRLALPEAAVTEADDHTFHVVLTHSHALDLEIVAAVLARPNGFCGLIGSATKRATFARRLAKRGIDDAGLTCPIGIDGITDKAPAAIAASVAAQLLCEREKRALREHPATAPAVADG